MSDYQVTDQAKLFFEESLALNQVFKALPEGTEIQVRLDERVNGVLSYDGDATRFNLGEAKKPDFTVDLSSEALRRLGDQPPSELTALSRELFRETLSGQVSWKAHLSVTDLKEKGYVQSLKDLGPTLQGEVFQVLMIWLGTANEKFEMIKSRFTKS